MIRDTDNTIVKIKVKVSQIKTFPFDIVYVVNQDVKDLIPRLFPYCIGLPFNTDLIRRLKVVCSDVSSVITVTQRDMSKVSATIGPLAIDWVQVQKSFLVIPILPRTHKDTRSQKRKDRNPAYLVANTHRGGTVVRKGGLTRTVNPSASMKEFLPFFNDFAVMFTPRGPLRPICKACPRHLEHVQGKCSLGDQCCYSSLVIKPERRQTHEQL